MSHQYYSCRSWFLGQKSAHPKAKQAKKPHFPAPFRGKLSLLPCQSAIYNCNTRACHELISKVLGLKGLQKPFPKEAESISYWKSKTCRWKTPWFMTRSSITVVDGRLARQKAQFSAKRSRKMRLFRLFCLGMCRLLPQNHDLQL